MFLVHQYGYSLRAVTEATSVEGSISHFNRRRPNVTLGNHGRGKYCQLNGYNV